MCGYELCSWIIGIGICCDNLKILGLFVLSQSVVLGGVHT